MPYNFIVNSGPIVVITFTLLAGMFKVTKSHMGLEVAIVEDKVVLTPHALYPRMSKAALAIAQSEELLANNFLQQHIEEEPVELLKSYFLGRGWRLT